MVYGMCLEMRDIHDRVPQLWTDQKIPRTHSFAPPKKSRRRPKICGKSEKGRKKDPTKTVKTVYEDVCAKNASTVPPPFWTMKSSLYRARAKRVPKIPHDAKNFEITGKRRKKNPSEARHEGTEAPIKFSDKLKFSQNF